MEMDGAKKQRVFRKCLSSPDCVVFMCQRDLHLEFKLNQWIEGIILEPKPCEQSFEEWIADGTVLSK